MSDGVETNTIARNRATKQSVLDKSLFKVTKDDDLDQLMMQPESSLVGGSHRGMEVSSSSRLTVRQLETRKAVQENGREEDFRREEEKRINQENFEKFKSSVISRKKREREESLRLQQESQEEAVLKENIPSHIDQEERFIKKGKSEGDHDSISDDRSGSSVSSFDPKDHTGPKSNSRESCSGVADRQSLSPESIIDNAPSSS